MRFIEDENIRDRYKNEKIFIVGRGPSLDDFPDNFFDNKIMITVNDAYLAVPITENIYISGMHANVLDSLQKTEPELLIHGLAFCPVDRTHDSRGNPWNQIGRYGEIPIYAKAAIGGQEKERFEESARQIMNHQPAIFRSRGTSSHPAIQAAVVLGAKKVTLVGCDERCKKFQYVWERSRRGKTVPLLEPREECPQELQEGKGGFIKYKEGRIWLTQAFKSYGIKIQRYFYKDGEYYKKGYEEIN